MAKLPPRPVRRLVVTPLVFVAALVVVVLSPALVLSAALSDLVVRSRWRTTRLTVLGVVFAALEVAGILVMLVLWIVGQLAVAGPARRASTVSPAIATRSS